MHSQEVRDALKEYRLGNYKTAVEICLAELQSSPANMDSHTVLCWSLVQLGRYDEAARYAVAARAINLYDPRIVEILAEARYHQGRNEESIKLFQEYLTLAPEGGRVDSAYYYMGELFIRFGRFRHADIALSAAVRYASGNAAWWTRLGYARERANDQRYSIAAYEQALALDPHSADARLGLDRARRGTAAR